MTGPGFLSLVRRRWWLLAAGALMAALPAWLVASNAPRTYQADAKLLVGPVSADYQTLQAAGMIGRTYADLAASRPIAEAAARAARVPLSPKQVEKRVSANSSDVTRIVDVRVRDSNPAAAARLANAIAAQLVQLRHRVPVERTDPSGPLMQEPALARLPHKERRAIRDAVLRVVWLSHAGDLAVVDAAVAPRSPVAPRTGLLVIVAALGGALLAVLCAVVWEAMAAAPREGEPFDGFDVESFVQSPNGGEEALDLERWLDQARTEELS